MRCGPTHHNACDCREAEFEKLREENARLRAALEYVVFIGTKGTARILPAATLEACVIFCRESLKAKEHGDG